MRAIWDQFPEAFIGPDDQGFVTDSGQWVNRADGYIIAKDAGQIIGRDKPNCYDGPNLYSEDLW